MSDTGPRRRWRWLSVLVFAVALYVMVRAADTPQGDKPPPPKASVTPRTPSPGSSAPSPTPPADSSYDPADHASQVLTRARQTGVSAPVLMAILYNEAYTPHTPSFERAWQRFKPDAAFGIADMHRATFDEVKQGRDFADRRWEELPDDRGLAIEAEAWYLHDLAARLPAQWPAAYPKSDLLALGYNAGPDDMLSFATGAPPGTQARSYLERLHANWAKAGRAVGVG